MAAPRPEGRGFSETLMKTQPLGPFLGTNNRAPDFSLHVPKVGDFLRSALNVDLDNKGNITRRNATELVQDLTDAHSLHMTSDTDGYAVISSALYAITLPAYTQTLIKLLSSNAPMSYAAAGADLYYSNGTDSGRVTGGVWFPLGIATPDSPTLSLVGGDLLPGWYQVGVSYSNSVTGEESGISASGNIELTAQGGIRTTLPAATPGADRVNIYLSAANGEVPMWLAQVPVGAANYDCIALATGRESTGRFEAPLPAGDLFMSNGRLCSFSGNVVYVGSPWRYGYHITAESYIEFPAAVTVAIENQGGTYIVADKTRFFPGSDLGNVEAMINDVLPYGAVRGTAFCVPNKPLVGWFGENGVVLADTQGVVDALTEDVMDVVLPVSGNAVVFWTDGYRRVVSCGYCVNLETKALTTYSDWEFTSVSGNYGTKVDGIYLLNTTGNVPWSVGFGKQDFGAENFKHLPAVYLGGNSEEPLTLTVGLPDGTTYDYDARSASTDTKIQRVDPGKGLRANWYDLTLSNATGSDFTLASVSFAPTVSTRRI